MIKKFLLISLILLFTGSVWADPSGTNLWVKDGTVSTICPGSNTGCFFDITGSTSTSGMFRVQGQGATVVMNELGQTNGVSYAVIRNVSNKSAATATLVTDGQPFTGCEALTADYCVLIPGFYWIEFTAPAVGLLKLNGIP